MKLYINIRKILFVISLVIMCGFKNIEMPYFTRYGIGMLWIIYSLSVKSKGENIIGKKIAFMFWLPYLFMFIVSPVLILLNSLEEIELTSSMFRLFSQMIQACITVGFSYAGFRLFGSETEHVFFDGLIINNLIGIVLGILKFGFSQLIEFVLNPFNKIWNTWTPEGRISNALELHEVTFALGLFWVFFVFCKKNKNYYFSQNDVFRFVICSVLILLGFKRIQLLALLAVLVLLFLLSKKNEFYYNIIWISTVLIMYFYLAIISTNFISVLAVKFEINFMSRLEWFLSLTRYFYFSPLFLGRGWGTVSLIVDYLGQGTHNDIMRNYIEFGFVGFFVWISYYLRYIPQKLLQIERNIAMLFFLMIVYTMITYMTDNTFTYMIFQSTLIVIIMSALDEYR